MWIEDEHQQDPYNRATPTASTPSVGAGAGAAAVPTGTTSNPSTQTPTNTNAPTQNFGTVQDYLKGNQQQGEALGQQFTGNLANTQTNEKNAINTATKQTASDITGGTTNYDPNLVNKALSTPTEITGNPDQLSSFLKQWNASYTGPSSFEASKNYTPAITAANEATGLGEQEKTTGGQQQILHDQFGVYGQGNQGLDQAVLQNSSYFPKVQEQAKEFGTVQDYLKQQAQPLNVQAQAATTAAPQTQAAVRNQFNTGVTGLGNQVASEQSALQAAGGSASNLGPQKTGVENSTVKNFLAMFPPNPTDADFARLGTTREEYDSILRSINATSANPNISNPLYANNTAYSNDLARYLEAQKLQKQAINS